MLVFRAIGPIDEVIECIRLRILEHEKLNRGPLTILEMMQEEMADGHE